MTIRLNVTCRGNTFPWIVIAREKMFLMYPLRNYPRFVHSRLLCSCEIKIVEEEPDMNVYFNDFLYMK